MIAKTGLSHHGEQEATSTEESRLRQALALAASGLGLEVPTLCLERVARTGARGLADRQNAASSLIGRTLARHLELRDGDPLPFDPEWLPDGRLQFAATPASGLGLSLGQDQDGGDAGYRLCAIGEWPQGCSIRELGKEHSAGVPRSGSAPGALVAPESEPGVLTELRLACAREAVARASGDRTALLTLKARRGEAILFEASSSAGRILVLTVRVRDSQQTDRNDRNDQNERMIAVTVQSSRNSQEANPVARGESRSQPPQAA